MLDKQNEHNAHAHYFSLLNISYKPTFSKESSKKISNDDLLGFNLFILREKF